MNHHDTDTEQRTAEVAELRQRLFTLMSNLPGMAYRCRNDPQWTMEFVSDGCSNLTGYQASELMHNRTLAYGDIIHPDDRQVVYGQVQQALAERRRFQLEYRIRTARGEERWVWEQGVGVFSGNAELQYLEGFITDITDRRRAEDELQNANSRLEKRVEERTAELTRANQLLQQEVEQRRRTEEELVIFHQFAEASGQGLGMADPDGYITYVNPTLFRWSNEKTPQDCIGKPLSAYMPTDYRQRRETEILPSLLQKGMWQGEESVVLRDGRVVPTIFTVFPVRDKSGKLLRTAVVISDITELKRAEQAVRQSEAKYRALVESCPDAVVMADLQGRIVFASQRVAEQHGVFPPDDLIGSQATDFVAASERDKFRASLGHLMEAGVHRNVQYTLLRKDGTTFDAEVSSAVIRDATGNPEALMAVYRDISERMKTEEKLKNEQRALRRMVLASDHERHLITYELHDGAAQQLMGAIMLFQSQRLHKVWKSAETEAAYRDGMVALRRASSELRRVMNWLRTPALEQFGVMEAITDVVSQLRLTPGAPEIEYCQDVKFQRLEPTLENTLFRIAQEAMTNACRHSKSERVRVTLAQNGDDVTLEVRDWGIGCDLESIAKGHFGLEGIRQRVRLLGGRLTIESTPGAGTTVQAVVPLLEKSVEA